MCSKVSFAIKETDNMIAHSRVFNQCTSAFSGVYGVCVCVCVCVEIGHREKHTKKFEGVLDGLKPRPRSVTPSLCALPRHFTTSGYPLLLVSSVRWYIFGLCSTLRCFFSLSSFSP